MLYQWLVMCLLLGIPVALQATPESTDTVSPWIAVNQDEGMGTPVYGGEECFRQVIVSDTENQRSVADLVWCHNRPDPYATGKVRVLDVPDRASDVWCGPTGNNQGPTSVCSWDLFLRQCDAGQCQESIVSRHVLLQNDGNWEFVATPAPEPYSPQAWE